MDPRDPDHDINCYNCKGSGWDSAARQAGLENSPVYYRPIGVWQCPVCRGTGRAIDAMAEEMRRFIDEATLTELQNEIRNNNFIQKFQQSKLPPTNK